MATMFDAKPSTPLVPLKPLASRVGVLVAYPASSTPRKVTGYSAAL